MISAGLALLEPRWLPVWPSLSALLVVFVWRSALAGLLTGALSGTILLSGGRLAELPSVLVSEQFLPIFASEWKLSALAFTLILGGFVALLEAGGGLQAISRHLLGAGRAPAKRMQASVMGFGLFVFFDGLANTMLVGRVLRSAADRCGVSREKLAYLADTTGSAVACIAFVSTWIAFQLSMIREGFATVGADASAFGLFFRSIPVNFYCLFALALAGICIARNFNPGPMGACERRARLRDGGVSPAPPEQAGASHWLTAVGPVLLLAISIPVGSYLLGAEQVWPVTPQTFAAAYAEAEAQVPALLVGASVLACIAAALAWRWFGGRPQPSVARLGAVFGLGVRELSKPVLVLLAAWMLGAAVRELGAAAWLGAALEGRLPPMLLPVLIFLLGAVISFSTGTSWGTMGVLMPLAIPVIYALTEGGMVPERESLVVAAIGAVFSGAVFGDHCSPFSDTTLVASIASGVEPVDHVRTQLPFALIAAGLAAVVGFIPLGFDVPSWICLLAGLGCLLLLPSLRSSNDEVTY